MGSRINMMMFGIFSLFLHAPILEPYLDLTLCQENPLSDLYPPLSCQILTEAVLLLQLKCLLSWIDLSMLALIMWTLTLNAQITFKKQSTKSRGASFFCILWNIRWGWEGRKKVKIKIIPFFLDAWCTFKLNFDGGRGQK